MNSMINFLLFEYIDLSIMYVSYFIIGPKNNILKHVEFCSGVYITLQAMGLILIKKTRDPLERISKLGYLKLVSINQVLTEEYMINIFANTEWKDLSS